MKLLTSIALLFVFSLATGKPPQAEQTIIVPAPQVSVSPNLKADITATLKQNPSNPWPDFGKQLLTVLGSWVSAGIGGFVAYRIMIAKATKDDESERRKQRALRHKERSDALAELIGEVFAFRAAAFRTNEACTVFFSYHASKAINWEDKRQEFFAHRTSLQSDVSRVNSKAERYGLLPEMAGLESRNLSTYVNAWVEFMVSDACNNDGDRSQYKEWTEELVSDLRRLRQYEDETRTAIVEESDRPKMLDTEEFTWLKDRMLELGDGN